MSDTLIAKELRHRLKAALSAASITVDAGAGAVAVSVLDVPPAGWVLSDDRLPALYVFTSGELLSYESLSEVERSPALDVVLLARGGGDPCDQLDDMQLAVERIVIAGDGFGIARTARLTSVEVPQNSGAPMLGARLMRYVFTYGVTPGDPSL